MKKIAIIVLLLVFSSILVSAENVQPSRDPSEPEGPAINYPTEGKVNTTPSKIVSEKGDGPLYESRSFSEDTLPVDSQGKSESGYWGFSGPSDKSSSVEEQGAE